MQAMNYAQTMEQIKSLGVEIDSNREAKAKVAVEMVDISKSIGDKDQDNEKLHKDFAALRSKHDDLEAIMIANVNMRQSLNEKVAQLAVVRHAAGDDKPLMRFSDALGEKIMSRVDNKEASEAATDTLAAVNVSTKSVSGGIRTNQVMMTAGIATRDSTGNNADSIANVSYTNALPVFTENFYGVRLRAYGGVLKMCSIITTPNGNAVEYPNVDYLALQAANRNEGERVAPQSMPAPNEVTLRPYSFSSGRLEISHESLRDVPASILGIANAAVRRALKYKLNDDLTNGTGTGNKSTQGVLTGAGASGIANLVNANAGTLEWDAHLLKLIHSVDPAYRGEDYDGDLTLGEDVMMGRVGWMFHDTFLAAVRGLKDTQDRPLWLPDIRGGMNHTLNGYGYTINQHLPTFVQETGTVKKVCLFGDFSTYFCREIPAESYVDYYTDDMELRERKKVAVNGFHEACGAYLSGFSSGNTSEAVKYLALAGS